MRIAVSALTAVCRPSAHRRLVSAASRAFALEHSAAAAASRAYGQQYHHHHQQQQQQQQQQQHKQQRRGLSSSSKGPEDADSHDDFKPQRKAPPADLDDAVQMIDDQVKKHKIMLYMKGTPARPQCGFSAQLVRVLHASGVDFDSVNVLDYPMIREGVKKYSNWPTIPQLYVDAQFIGGCDIVTSLFQSGELAKIFEESAGGNGGSK